MVRPDGKTWTSTTPDGSIRKWQHDCSAYVDTYFQGEGAGKRNRSPPDSELRRRPVTATATAQRHPMAMGQRRLPPLAPHDSEVPLPLLHNHGRPGPLARMGAGLRTTSAAPSPSSPSSPSPRGQKTTPKTTRSTSFHGPQRMARDQYQHPVADLPRCGGGPNMTTTDVHESKAKAPFVVHVDAQGRPINVSPVHNPQYVFEPSKLGRKKDWALAPRKFHKSRSFEKRLRDPFFEPYADVSRHAFGS